MTVIPLAPAEHLALVVRVAAVLVVGGSGMDYDTIAEEAAALVSACARAIGADLEDR